MKSYLRIVLLVTAAFMSLTSCAQNGQKAFSGDIAAFKKKDKSHFPPKNAILFTGSSSFTMWQDVQEYFPGHTIINRGFGGSQLIHLIEYADEIIYPYEPKQIVIYCGENDIAAGATASETLERFKKLFNMIRKQLPHTQVLYVSMKPSPSRQKFREIVEEGNMMIQEFLIGFPNTGYVDIYEPMLGKNGQPMPELFLGDSLHMNKNGYAIWKKAIGPKLLD